MLKIKSSLFNFFSEIKTQNFRDDALLVQEIHSFIHSFIFYLKVIVTSILHRLFLLAPTLPLNYPYIVTFHLVSGDLQGGNNRNKLLKMQCSIYSFIRPFWERIFLAMAWTEKEKTCTFVQCLTDNAVDHLMIGSN